jgi:hypothetical protein
MEKPERPNRKQGSLLWDGLNRGTAWLYALILHSWIGRLMTSFRKTEAAISYGRVRTRRHACAPMSSGRMRLVRAVEGSHLFVLLRGIFRGFLGCPTALYGLFGLIQGLCGVAFYFILPYLYPSLTPTLGDMIQSALLAGLSLPLLLTRKTLAGVLSSSRLIAFLLFSFLGIPRESLDIPRDKRWNLLFYPMPLLGVAAAFAALWSHPLLIPLCLIGLGVQGMIFAYPETGVVLFTVTLPAVWANRSFIIIPAILILLTWLSYGVKLLFLHRTIRFGLLDRVVFILMVLMLACGCVGSGLTASSVTVTLFLVISCSAYFLVVNLITTRIYVRRCLLGVGISVGLVTALAYLRLISVDSLAWLEGSRAGDAIINGFRNGYERLSTLWVEHSELYLVLSFPWLCAYMMHTKRLFRRVMGMCFVALDAILIVMTHSISAMFCIIAVTVLFFLFLHHRWLSVGVLAVPAVGCGFMWLTYLYPITDSLKTILSRSRLYKSQLSHSLWDMVWDHPAGIGVGEEAFAAIYPAYAAPDLGAVTDSGSLLFEILLSYGWPGLIMFAALLFFFLQKGLTCLGHTAVTKDRAIILGGMASLVGVVIFGAVRSFITSPRVFFTILLMIALCSAYENIIFDEYDVTRASWESTPEEDSRLFRRR